VPKVTEQYRSDRRAAITAAAARCFAAKGVHQTSMADIIAASGLSAGAIYNHYRSKEELTVAVAASLVRGRLQAALQALDVDHAAPAPDRLVRAALDSIRSAPAQDHTPLGTLILQFWAEATVNPTMLALMQEQMLGIKEMFLDPVRRWAREQHGLTARRADRWSEEISQVLISIMIGFVVQRSLFPGFDENAYLRSATGVVGAGTPGGWWTPAPDP
jgi:AcrR family transcriptional regulator